MGGCVEVTGVDEEANDVSEESTCLVAVPVFLRFVEETGDADEEADGVEEAGGVVEESTC